MSRRISYTQDQWIALVNEIEAEGGFQAEDEYGHLDECTPRTYDFIGPKKLDLKDRVIEGCGNESIFEVAYDPHEPIHMELDAIDFHGDLRRDEDGDPITICIDHSGEAGALGEAHSVTVCAVCDGIGWWPRYAHVMEDE